MGWLEKYQDGGSVPKRVGTRKNSDGSESTHLMRAEKLNDSTWVGFPSLFQNKDESWKDMSETPNWMDAYEEAEKRGEVRNFGRDSIKALDYGEGSWKKPKLQEGGKVKDERYQSVKTKDNIPQQYKRETKPMSEDLAKIIAYQKLIEQTGEITPHEGQGNLSKLKEIALNPVTAFGYAARNQRLPDNFSRGERNATDYALDVINPAQYIQDATNVIEGTATGDLAQIGEGALGVVPLGLEIKNIKKYANKLGKIPENLENKVIKDIRDGMRKENQPGGWPRPRLPAYTGIPGISNKVEKVFNKQMAIKREEWLKGPKMNNKQIPLDTEEKEMLRGMWKEGDTDVNNFVSDNHGFSMWLNKKGKFTHNMDELNKFSNDEKLVNEFLDEYLVSVRGVAMDQASPRKIVRDAIVEGGEGRAGSGNYSSNSAKILDRFSTPYKATQKGYQTKLELNLNLEGLAPKQKLNELNKNIHYSSDNNYITHGSHNEPSNLTKPIIEQPYFGDGYERVVRKDQTNNLLKIKKLKSVDTEVDTNVQNLMGYQGLKDSEHLPGTFFLDDKFYSKYKTLQKHDKRDIAELTYYHMNKHNLSHTDREKYRKLVRKIDRNKNLRKGNFADTDKLDEGYLTNAEKYKSEFKRTLKGRKDDLKYAFEKTSKTAGSILGGIGVTYGGLRAMPESASTKRRIIKMKLQNNEVVSAEDRAWMEERDSLSKRRIESHSKSKLQNGGIIEDDRGQWAHPGEVTKINSNNITMKGVDYPVLGVSDTGDKKIMMPGEDYKFKGNSVTEYPQAQNGGWLDNLQSPDKSSNFTGQNTWLNKYTQ